MNWGSQGNSSNSFELVHNSTGEGSNELVGGSPTHISVGGRKRVPSSIGTLRSWPGSVPAEVQPSDPSGSVGTSVWEGCRDAARRGVTRQSDPLGACG